MNMHQSAGQKVRAALDSQLDEGMVWHESELLTLDAIEHATDRLAVFAARFGELAADPKSEPSRLATLSAECRLLEGAIQKWTATLDPRAESAKSLRHVAAANSRWHRASGV